MKLSLAAILVAALTLLREAGCFRISGDFGDNAIDMKVEVSPERVVYLTDTNANINFLSDVLRPLRSEGAG